MRWLPLTLLVVMTAFAGRADGKPVRFDRADEYKPQPPCARTADWNKFARCQLKQIKFELLDDRPTAKLVAYPISYSNGSKRLELYLLSNNAWAKSGLYAETNASTELLAFQPVSGDAYRLDMGFASTTWVTLDEMGSRPALVRRAYTYVCSATNGCRTVQTACDLLVHGKAVASFRGVARWDGGTLILNGVAQNTNRYCPAPPNLVPPGEVP